MSVTLRPEFPAPPPRLLAEADMITPDLTIDRAALMEIARHRALREYQAYVDMGVVRSWDKLLAAEVTRLEDTARAVIECRRQWRDVQELTPQERLVRQLELKLEKLRHGLGMPRDPDAIKHHKALLKQARAASSNDPGVLVAVQLRENQ